MSQIRPAAIAIPDDGLGQRGGVPDAVADHDDPVPVGLGRGES
jgi:hypothetical protein